jgi:6-phosphogluconolactonase (cycloisomerase 2 family)
MPDTLGLHRPHRVHRLVCWALFAALSLGACGSGDTPPTNSNAGGGTPLTYGIGGTTSVGGFVFVANSGADSISEFTIDPASGALAAVGPPVATDRGPTAIAGTFDKKYLYVSNSGSNDVAAFSIDLNSGALTTVPGAPFAAGKNPSAVAVYTASFVSSKGGGVGPVSYRGYAYAANTGSDTVSAYQIDQNTGVLTPIASYATGTGPSVIAVRADGEFLFIANTGGSRNISAFQINGYYGDLSPVVGSPFSSGDNVSSLAFGAGEAFLYAANASGGTASIMEFSIHPLGTDANSGALTALPGVAYDLPSCNYITTDQTGALLYATAGTNVFGFSIDQHTGTLSPLPGFPVAVGGSADSVSIDPTNQFLYVTNRSTGKVNGFNLNSVTGELTTMPGSPPP